MLYEYKRTKIIQSIQKRRIMGIMGIMRRRIIAAILSGLVMLTLFIPVSGSAQSNATGLDDAKALSENYQGNGYSVSPAIPESDGTPAITTFAETTASVSATSSKNAIIVLPGYLGSELYEGAYGVSGGTKLWVDALSNIGWWSTDKKQKFVQDINSNGTQTHVEFYNAATGYGDDYGAQNQYQSLITSLKSKFSSKYEVVFFPYNWLENLNDEALRLEKFINNKGYGKVVLITHSTGGLLASTYVARSRDNKLKVAKAILIAPPLLGTYAALFPIERGDSGDFFQQGFWNNVIDALTSNKWIKSWAHSSPTTYQLLPSNEYLEQIPLLDKRGLFQSDLVASTASAMYSVMNQSDNINPRLTNGSNKGHKYFRETVLGGDIVNGWIDPLNTLLTVDTVILGATGISTPSKAIYKEPLIGTNRVLDSIEYSKNGDGTVQSISALAQKKGQATRFKTTKMTYKTGHGDLVKDSGLINDVCNYISSINLAGVSLSTFMSQDTDDMQEIAEVGAGMTDVLKIKYDCDKSVTATIYDIYGAKVAQAAGYDEEGFDGNDFIYDFTAFDEEETGAQIYMPCEGYKLVFTYGESKDLSINYDVSVSTLDFDGNASTTVEKVLQKTSVGGYIVSIDGTGGPITDENIGEKIIGKTTVYFTDWELVESLKAKSGDIMQAEITGSEAKDVEALLSWSSSDEAVATVDSNGNIAAIGFGSAVIAATDGNKIFTTIVTVAQEAQSVDFADTGMVVGERVLINPVFMPDNTTETDVIYEYDDNGGIIYIDDGVIIAFAPGVVDVTIAAPGGARCTFTVTVFSDSAAQEIPPVTSIKIDASAVVSVVRGKTYSFAAIVNEGASGDGIVWSVNNPLCAAVDSYGNVTIFNKVGTLVLTATAPSGKLSHSIILRIT